MEHQACDAGDENSDATDNVDDAKGSRSLDHVAFLDLCPLLRHLDDIDDLLRGSWLFHLGRGLINLKQLDARNSNSSDSTIHSKKINLAVKYKFCTVDI